MADGYCLDPTDLAASKIVAWREKDKAFTLELLKRKVVQMPTLTRRLTQFSKEQLAKYQLTQDDLTKRLAHLAHALA